MSSFDHKFKPAPSPQAVTEELLRTTVEELALVRQENDRLHGELAKVEAERDLAQAKAATSDLHGLAKTVRQCLTNGHPDMRKHLEVLLAKIGV